MRIYGSINNRFDEGHKFCKEIKVGTGMTEYMWSDRHPYEVTRVIDQEHVFVRPMDHKRTDSNGMSECQDYEYISNPNYSEIEVMVRRGKWYKVFSYNKEELMKKVDELFANKKEMLRTKEDELKRLCEWSNFTEKQQADFDNGKTIKKYQKWNNISFGVMEYYYDFSF